MTQAELMRFDAAINPYGCSPAVVDALVAAAQARAFRHYGDVDARALREGLARHYHLHPDNFVVYNGSGEAHVWQCVARLLIARGVFICPYPSYERFVEVGRRCARSVVEVPLVPGSWTLPVDDFIAAARGSGATVAMISSPNNPTGNCILDESSLTTLLDALPECTFLLDEAYAEYTSTSFAGLVRTRRNLIVLKTFSKAYGLAGLRVGYLVAHPDVAAGARMIQIPWSVDSLALTAAEAALGDQAYLREVVTRIRNDLGHFQAGLGRLAHVRAYPSDANFVLAELVGTTWQSLEPRLAARGIVVRRRADMPEHIRVTCMTPEANEVLLQALAAEPES
jgi:histidinol-phosphate aminotransferase